MPLVSLWQENVKNIRKTYENRTEKAFTLSEKLEEF